MLFMMLNRTSHISIPVFFWLSRGCPLWLLFDMLMFMLSVSMKVIVMLLSVS